MIFEVTEEQVKKISGKAYDAGHKLGKEHGFEEAMHQMLILSHSDFMEMTTPKDVIEHIVRLARGIKQNSLKQAAKL